MPEPVATDLYTIEDAEDHIGDLRGKVDRLGEIVSLDQTDVTPNTVAGQTQLYSDQASGLLSVVSDSGAQGDIPWTRQAAFPGNTVTAATLQNLASATYTGGDAVVGAIYELDVWGNGIQGSTRQTLELAVNFGGTTMSADVIFGTTAFSAINVAFRWRAQGRVICNTTGAGGTWTSFIDAKVNDFTGNIAPGNNNMGTAFSCESTGTTAVDTTVDQTLKVLAAWGSTTGGPTLTSRVALFRRIA